VGAFVQFGLVPLDLAPIVADLGIADGAFDLNHRPLLRITAASRRLFDLQAPRDHRADAVECLLRNLGREREEFLALDVGRSHLLLKVIRLEAHELGQTLRARKSIGRFKKSLGIGLGIAQDLLPDGLCFLLGGRKDFFQSLHVLLSVRRRRAVGVLRLGDFCAANLLAGRWLTTVRQARPFRPAMNPNPNGIAPADRSLRLMAASPSDRIS
jgi:hypothetical protein